MVTAFLVGALIYFVIRCGLTGFYTVNQNERAVLTSFGRAMRIPGQTTLTSPISESLRPEEKDRYCYPQLYVITPGGPYFKWPWQKVHKVSIATETVNMAHDPDQPNANKAGTELEAVTKDQLNIGLTGQIRFRVHESNLYAVIFGVKSPLSHVMGYFVSILRERIANYEAPKLAVVDVDEGESQISVKTAVSINDLRKNLRELNDQMVEESKSSVARYGILLEASLITELDPPTEVESALAAINTAHNNVSAAISRARAGADQTIVQSRRAVEIETLKAKAEVEPLLALNHELKELKGAGALVLQTYVRNVRLSLFSKATRMFLSNKD